MDIETERLITDANLLTWSGFTESAIALVYLADNRVTAHQLFVNSVSRRRFWDQYRYRINAAYLWAIARKRKATI